MSQGKLPNTQREASALDLARSQLDPALHLKADEAAGSVTKQLLGRSAEGQGREGRALQVVELRERLARTKSMVGVRQALVTDRQATSSTPLLFVGSLLPRLLHVRLDTQLDTLCVDPSIEARWHQMPSQFCKNPLALVMWTVTHVEAQKAGVCNNCCNEDNTNLHHR